MKGNKMRLQVSQVVVALVLIAGGSTSCFAQVINAKGAASYTVGTFVPDGVLRSPSSVAVDNNGNIYIVDAGNFVVRKYNSAGAGNVLAGVEGSNQKAPAQTVAQADRVAGQCYTKTGDHCTATQAVFSSPRDVAIDQAGNVYISDISAGKIRRIDITTGIVTTYAGGVEAGWSATQLHAPSGMAFDSKGNLYVADKVNNAVRMIAPPVAPATKGTITAIAGLGPTQPGCAADGAVASTAMLTRPQDVAVDAAGNIYIADTGCRKIRMIATDGTMTTIAGTGADHVGTPAEVPFTASSGKALAINLANPTGIALDKSGNLLISDPGFDVVWFYKAAGTIQVLAGLAPQASVCSTGSNPQGDGCQSNAAFINIPAKPAIDGSGNVYIPEQGGTQSPTHPFTVRILRISK
jgi:trimeric autotransporter adhesin